MKNKLLSYNIDMIKLTKINNVVVKPIKIKENQLPVKGSVIVGSSPYVNMMLVSPTFGGKTTAMSQILRECVVPRKTVLVLFVSSIYNDDNWIAIRQYYEDLGNEVIVHTSLKDEDGNNILKGYVKKFSNMAEEREKKRRLEKENAYIVKQDKIHIYFQDKEEVKEAEKKPKYQFAEHIFIFDDISDEIKSSAYESFIKAARHFRCLTITSSQDLKDIKPATAKQMRVWLLFKNIGEERLEHIHRNIGLNIPFNQFQCFYQNATKDYYDNVSGQLKKFNFLFFMPRTLEFRKNFNTLFNYNECPK